MAFWERIEDLCKKENTNITSVLKELNISTSKGTAWRNGSIPNGAILAKLADRFHTSVDYLLCRTDERNLITKHAASAVDDTQYDDLPEEALQEMENYRKYLIDKYKNK